MSGQANKAKKDKRDPKVGYKLRYTGPKPESLKGVNSIHLVPDLSKNLYVHHPPVVGADECPTCGIIHLCKTHHLNLNQNNMVIVSLGVLQDLERLGLALNDLESDGIEPNPPTLTVDGKTSRREVDQINEKIVNYGSN
jgi:hypothetical protein